MRVLARGAGPAVAGAVESMVFNVSSGRFTLQYGASASVPAAQPTEIFIWPPRYPGGADVAVEASDGSVLSVEYESGSSRVRIYLPAGGLSAGTRVKATVSRREAKAVEQE